MVTLRPRDYECVCPISYHQSMFLTMDYFNHDQNPSLIYKERFNILGNVLFRCLA